MQLKLGLGLKPILSGNKGPAPAFVEKLSQSCAEMHLAVLTAAECEASAGGCSGCASSSTDLWLHMLIPKQIWRV